MRLFLLLCLAAGSASASEDLHWRNEHGWDFVLTQDKPDWCGGMDMMYSVSPKGDANYGCYRVMNDRVHVQFQKGLIRDHVFDASNFERRQAGQPTAAKINQLR